MQEEDVARERKLASRTILVGSLLALVTKGDSPIVLSQRPWRYLVCTPSIHLSKARYEIEKNQLRKVYSSSPCEFNALITLLIIFYI